MKRESIYDLTAIQIGINNKSWDFKHEEDSFDTCVHFMKTNRYDILPLRNKEGGFNHFAVTDQWNHFDKISLKHKSELPKLRADSNFLKVLDAFSENNQKYFLLHKGTSIVGLISIVNFSYREIYKRLYDELAELEILLANNLLTEVTEEEIFQMLLKKNQSDVSKSSLGQYLIDQRLGIDGPLKEYLYLSSLLSIVKLKKLNERYGMHKAEFQDISQALFAVRNAVAHPVRSIIREKDDFKRVLICLEASKRICDKLNRS